MSYLIDTNILLRLCDKNNSKNLIIRQAIHTLRIQGNNLYIYPQNCAEFWNVATRPANKNGLGLTIEKTAKSLKLIERIFTLIPDISENYHQWKQLIITYQVKGVQVHDARLVATMKTYNVSHILTFNIDDFQRYSPEGITPINPDSLIT